MTTALKKNKGNIITLWNESEEIYDAINTFLERIKQNSENSARNYLSHIKQFFKITRNKELKHLTYVDLMFTLQEVEKYQVALRDKYKTSTVNAKMSAVKELFKKLDAYGFNIDPKAFGVDSYKVYDSDKWDSFTKEEVDSLIPVVRNSHRGEEKVLVIRIACETAFRSASIRSLTRKDIGVKNGVYYLETLGKGNKKDIKKITESLYTDLLKNWEKNESDRLIELNHNHIQDMMNLITDTFDFGDRNIVFHSFKKTSLNEMWERTGGNIKATQYHGAHSSSKTTMDNYLQDTNFDNSIVLDWNDEPNLDVLANLSKEALLEVISSLDRSTQFKLVKFAESI